MNRNQAKVISLLSAAVFLLALLISGRLFFRLDLTKNKAFTISEVSKNLYREISDQVRITYFVSEKLRQAHPMPGEIADLLREYAANSRGKIRFIQKDPAKAELLQEVEDLGIMPQQIQLAEKNEVTVATVYTGILIEYLDRESVIPVVFSLDTLEYDLSSRIRSLVRNSEKEIGVIVGDSYSQWNTEYGLLNQELVFSGFRIRLIKAGDYIPSNLPALFVFGGVEDLDEEQLLPIDNYISGGGNVLFALDGVFVDTRRAFEARTMQDKGLLAMLSNYGVVVRNALVLDTLALSITFQTQNRNATVIQTIRYPQWLGIPEQLGNPDHALTSRFMGLDLYWASPLELYPPDGVSADVLFSTSPEAWLQTRRFITNPNYYMQFQDEAEETRGTKILGVSLSGVFPSAFNSLPVLLKKPSRLIVVGNSRFAGSIMQANRGEERNLDFLIKAADWLSNDEDIVAIRGRQSQAGRLDRIADRVKRDRAMAFSRSINTIGIPLGVILIGLFINWKRKVKTSKDKGYGIDV
jgi:ABC-2 type transport system permease protein